MTFSGTSDPCALCSLHSIGKIGGAQNRTYSKLLCGLLADRLRISPDRCVASEGCWEVGRERSEGTVTLSETLCLAEPRLSFSQDLHQLLRHERSQCGLERFHLRLSADLMTYLHRSSWSLPC